MKSRQGVSIKAHRFIKKSVSFDGSLDSRSTSGVKTPIYNIELQNIANRLPEIIHFFSIRYLKTAASFHELFFAKAAGSFSSRSTSHGKSMNHITQRVAEKLPDIIFAKNGEPIRAL